MTSDSYRMLVGKHTDFIVNYFIEYSDENCETAYADVFGNCEKSLNVFDPTIFEAAYSELIKKDVVSISVKFCKFDGSCSIRGRLDPVKLMLRKSNAELNAARKQA